VQPGVVPADAAVANAAIAAGESGDGSFNHGPVSAVILLKGRVSSAPAVLALQRVVFVKFEFAASW
jgi:hypothetical protein